jgi:hypothetical protein
MYPAKPGFIIGFHGCDNSIRNKIVTGKAMLKASTNDYDWLGNGIYFWENNQQRAIDFAEELKKTPRKGKMPIKLPSVLGAVIDMGFCLDLLDAEHLQLIRQSYEELELFYQLLDLELPVNKNIGGSRDLLLRKLDCAVIENLHRIRRRTNLRPFDSVRGVFIEGEPLYPNAGFNEKNHIQTCIRNPNCIKGFFIPRMADESFLLP